MDSLAQALAALSGMSCKCGRTGLCISIVSGTIVRAADSRAAVVRAAMVRAAIVRAAIMRAAVIPVSFIRVSFLCGMQQIIESTNRTGFGTVGSASDCNGLINLASAGPEFESLNPDIPFVFDRSTRSWSYVVR